MVSSRWQFFVYNCCSILEFIEVVIYQEEMVRWQKHSQPGQAKRTQSERIQRKGVGVEPVWDPFPGMRISPASLASRLWEGCVRPDRLPFE
jgi:hypothetical protein